MELFQLPDELLDIEIARHQLDVVSRWLLGCTCHDLYRRVIDATNLAPPSKQQRLSEAPLIMATRAFEWLVCEQWRPIGNVLLSNDYFNYARNPNHCTLDSLFFAWCAPVPVIETKHGLVRAATPSGVLYDALYYTLLGLIHANRLDLVKRWSDEWTRGWAELMNPCIGDAIRVELYLIDLLYTMLQSRDYVRWFRFMPTKALIEYRVPEIISMLKSWEERERFMDLQACVFCVEQAVQTYCRKFDGLDFVNVNTFCVVTPYHKTHQTSAWTNRAQSSLPIAILEHLRHADADWIDAYIRLLPRDDFPPRIVYIITATSVNVIQSAPHSSWKLLKQAGLLSYAHIITGDKDRDDYTVGRMDTGVRRRHYQLLREFGTDGIVGGADMLAALERWYECEDRIQFWDV